VFPDQVSLKESTESGMVARVGKNGSWKAFGVPAQIVMDESPILASKSVSNLLALFGLKRAT
jgi:hypothetical protein